jgi:hypothetical protein
MSVVSLREVYPGWSATKGSVPDISISQSSLTVSGKYITVLQEAHFDSSARDSISFPILLAQESSCRDKCEYMTLSYMDNSNQLRYYSF